MMLVFGCGLGWFTAKRRQAQQAWKRLKVAEEMGITLSDFDRVLNGDHEPREATK